MVWWLMYETIAISVTKNLVSACLFQLSQPKKPILKLQIQKAHLVRYKKQLFGKKLHFGFVKRTHIRSMELGGAFYKSSYALLLLKALTLPFSLLPHILAPLLQTNTSQESIYKAGLRYFGA